MSVNFPSVNNTKTSNDLDKNIIKDFKSNDVKENKPISTNPTINTNNSDKTNKNLTKQASLEKQDLEFPSLDTAKKGGKYSDLWKPYGDDMGDIASKITTVDELKKSLGIKGDFSNAPKLKALLDSLKNVDSTTLGYINQIAKSSGISNFEQIAEKLTNYIKSGVTNKEFTKENFTKDVLHDIAYPSDINQNPKGTCGATSTQMKFATERPSEYVDIALTLAQNKNYKTKGGMVLKPNNTWVGDAGDYRSFSCKVIQNSFMDGSRVLAYDSVKTEAGPKSKQGTFTSGENTLVTNLYNDSDYEVNSTSDVFTGGSSNIYSYLEDEIARGRTATVSFKGHSVLAVGIDKTNDPPLVILNSWGRRYSMTVDEFKKCVVDIKSVDDSGWDDKKVTAGTKKIIGQ